MRPIVPLLPVDYLVIGHLTCDQTDNGLLLGGTAAYAGLTAQALGMRVGIVTAWGAEVSRAPLNDIPIISFPTDTSTTFANLMTEAGRVQYIRSVAPQIHLNIIPDAWRNPAIVHLGPVAQEVDPGLVRYFPSALIGLTPQGWLRGWDEQGLVHPVEWPEATFVLQRTGATVISREDVGGDETRIEEMASSSRILAVTEADQGTRLYWNGDVRRFRPPQVELVDDTGAGDIFAAAFFYRLYTTRDPWEAARFATLLSAFSVTRRGLDSIPTPEEVQACMVEVYE
jgi:sugar/nucleoside kinase (ribokinase family)